MPTSFFFSPELAACVNNFLWVEVDGGAYRSCPALFQGDDGKCCNSTAGAGFKMYVWLYSNFKYCCVSVAIMPHNKFKGRRFL